MKLRAWVMTWCCCIAVSALTQDFVPEDAVFQIPLPKGWKLRTVDKLDGLWQVVTIEKKGFTTSGAITLRWSRGNLALDSVALEVVSSFRRRMGIHDLRTSTGTFQERSSFHAEFFVAPLLPFLVEIKTFHACGFTFVYVVNVAKEDQDNRRDQIEAVEAGFLCRDWQKEE
jgi:hypothetical protein